MGAWLCAAVLPCDLLGMAWKGAAKPVPWPPLCAGCCWLCCRSCFTCRWPSRLRNRSQPLPADCMSRNRVRAGYLSMDELEM